jgi:hypothetical protein
MEKGQMISRSVTGLILSALLALPTAAEAQRRDSGFELGGLIGFELGDLDGFALRIDGDVDIQRLAPTFMLSGVGSFGYAHLSEDDFDLNMFELIPALRFTIDATPQVGVYGDLGLGLYIADYEGDHTDAGLAMRFGLGVQYAIAPRAKLVGEFAVLPRFALDFLDDTFFSFMVGAMFSL